MKNYKSINNKNKVFYLGIGFLTLLFILVIKNFLQGSATPQSCTLASEKTIFNTASEPYQWSTVKMGGGGFVTGVTIHPNEPDLIYVRTDVGGAFRWNPNNQSWTQLLTAETIPSLISYSVESLAIAPNNPNIIYLAVGHYTKSQNTIQPGTFLKSLNQGKTWQILDFSLPVGGNEPWRWTGERLVVDPHNSNIIYFASRLDGLWRSTNGGQSWSQINPKQVPMGQPHSEISHQAGVTFVAFDPNSNTIPNQTQTLYVGVAGEGIYRTTNGGTTWQRLENGPDAELVPQQAVVNSQGELITTFYRTEKDPRGSVWKFTSERWQEITPKPNQNYSAIAISSNPTDTLFVVSYPMTPNDIYRSENGGETWVQLRNHINPLSWWPEWSFYTLTGSIAASNFEPGQVWLTNGVGVWKTNSADQQQVKWSATVNGIEETVTFDAVSPPGGENLITAIADFDGFHHDNLCSVPRRNHSNGKFITTTSLAYSSSHPNFIVSAGASHHNPQEIRAGFSENYGKTWRNFPSIETATHPPDLVFGNIAVSSTDPNNIVWQGSNGKPPYFTKDRGRTWQRISFFEQEEIGGGTHTHLWNRQQALAADSVQEGTFYIYHHIGGRLLRSQDGGETWNIVNETLPDNVWQGANVKTAPGIPGEVWVSLSEKGLYRSSNFGEYFVKLAVDEANVIGFGKAAPGVNHPTVFMQGKINGKQGIFRSIDFGKNWVKISDYPMGYFGNLRVITGDMNLFGRVFLGTGGNGFMYGQPLEKQEKNSIPTGSKN